MTQPDILHLQRMIGNRATTALTRPSSGQRSSIQREIDYSGVANAPILQKAIQLFHTLEQPDLSPEEYNQLKTHQQHFMPLLARFETSPGVTLKIGTGPKRRVGDFAVTEFVGFIGDEALEYDSEKDRFNKLAEAGKFTRFEVRVLFLPLRVTGEESPGTLKTVGTVFQAFTHEMSLHAEYMLDYIERYWRHLSQTSGITPLGSADDEHKEYAKGENDRYEFMKARTQKLDDETVKNDFNKRESGEMVPFKVKFGLPF